MQTLRRYDMILGLRWMEAHGVLLDPSTRSLQFKKDHCTHPQKQPVRNPSPPPQPAVEDIREPFEPVQILRRSVGRNRREWDQRDSLRQMERELVKTENPKAKKAEPKVGTSNCRMLSAEAFYLYLKQEGTQVYQITIGQEDPELRHLQEALLDDLRPPKELEKALPDWLQNRHPEFAKELSDTFTTSPDFYHKIKLEGEPDLRTPPLFRMLVEEMEASKAYIKENRVKGFIEPSNANFGSPVLMAKKPGGGLRFCVDYRRLNAVTKKNRYPLPLIDETLAKLDGVRYFFKIDVRQAFHKIRMHPNSKDLTTFRTRYGSYRYNVMPFGLCNGPSTF